MGINRLRNLVAIYNQLRRRKLTVRQTVVVAIADCLSVMSGVIQKRVDGCGYVALLCPCSLFFPMKRDEERWHFSHFRLRVKSKRRWMHGKFGATFFSREVTTNIFSKELRSSAREKEEKKDSLIKVRTKEGNPLQRDSNFLFPGFLSLSRRCGSNQSSIQSHIFE